jgi:uncharacterized membrane protein YccC
MSSIIQTSKTLVHNALQIDKNMLSSGLRISIICIPPILIGYLVGQATAGIICFIAGLYAVLADVGGAYRHRAKSMGATTLLMTISAPIAILAGNNTWYSIALMFLWAFCGSMLGIFGNAGTKVGFSMIALVLILIGLPGNPATASITSISTLIGGVWAMLISLAFWPFRPYQPARVAIADYYRALHVFITKTCDPHPANVDINSRWMEAARRERTNVITAHDNVHKIIMDLRSARSGASQRGRNLLLLTLNADRLFDEVIALSEGIEHTSKGDHFAQVRAALTPVLPQLAACLNDLANALVDAHNIDCHSTLLALATCQEQLREVLPQIKRQYEAMAHIRSIVSVLDHISATLRSSNNALQAVQLDHDDASKENNHRTQTQHRSGNMQQALKLLQDNLSPRSIIFRYALRIAVTTAAAVAFYSLLHINHGYWITLTVFFIMKPDFGSTRRRLIHRIVGTVTGGIVVAVIVALIHNPFILAAFVILFSFMAYAHINGHYGIFVVFLTALVVITLDMGQPGQWQLALIRMGNTFIGGAMTFLAGYLFWPQWERERLPSQLAKTIAANRHYFHCVVSSYQQPTSHTDTLHIASKQAHIENANAEAAFQRLLGEPKTQQGDVERFYALVTYNLSFNDSITFLAEHIPAEPQRLSLPGLTEFREQTETVLQTIETMILTGQQALPPVLLEENLHAVEASLEHLLTAHISELTTRQLNTAQQATIVDYALVSTQLDRLTHDITGMVRIE